ncbi:12-oxophytodienoate reductase 3 [Dionaea muscipula]
MVVAGACGLEWAALRPRVFLPSSFTRLRACMYDHAYVVVLWLSHQVIGLGRLNRIVTDATNHTKNAAAAAAAAMAGSGETPALFTEYNLGPHKLSHRIVLAPLTRNRAIGSIPNEAMVKYYSDRATEGGLLITEATIISTTAAGSPHVPGIYTKEQIEGWKPVTEAVHAKGGKIMCQIWHVGRASHTVYQPGGAPPISSTNKPVSTKWKAQMPDDSYEDYSVPRALETSEIAGVVEDFRKAAVNAIEAGFDGIEIHGAQGYIIEQFAKDTINDRTDEYGGSLENRLKFLIEVVTAIVSAIGPEKTALRISPIVDYLDAYDTQPVELGLAIIDKLNKIQKEVGSKLLYLHVIQPRFMASLMGTPSEDEDVGLLKLLRKAYEGTFMSSGGYKRDSAIADVAHGDTDLVSFGRLFLANPDLVKRLKLNLPVNRHRREYFYTHDPIIGYNDYPFWEEKEGGAAAPSQ